MSIEYNVIKDGEWVEAFNNESEAVKYARIIDKNDDVRVYKTTSYKDSDDTDDELIYW